jgi:hypothetical protein
MLEGVDSQQFQSPLGNARSQSSPENVGSQQFQTTLEDVYAQSLKSSPEDSWQLSSRLLRIGVRDHPRVHIAPYLVDHAN